MTKIGFHGYICNNICIINQGIIYDFLKFCLMFNKYTFSRNLGLINHKFVPLFDACQNQRRNIFSHGPVAI